MKKVVVTNYGYIHYHAACSGGCDFTDAIGTGRNAAAVRRAVVKHVRETGHECWIEAGKHTTYRLGAVEHRLQRDGASRLLTGRNGKPTNVRADGTVLELPRR